MRPRHTFTERECLFNSARALGQRKNMTELNSSQDERELTEAAARIWFERAEIARIQGTWSHEYEALTD